MATSAAIYAGDDGPKRVAPVWHTVVLVGIYLVLTVSGAIFQRNAQAHPEALQKHPNVFPLYVYLLALEWGSVWYVAAGLRRTGTRLRDIVGQRWSNAREIARDLFLGLALWAGWGGVTSAWARWVSSDHAASIQPLLPKGIVESLLWIAVSISAGVCEEIVFRGYFQRQFTAFTRSATAAVALQAVLFGISHGYQGVQATIKIAVYGALFGLLALWRKSLRPGIIAHAWTDIFSGLFAR